MAYGPQNSFISRPAVYEDDAHLLTLAALLSQHFAVRYPHHS